MRGAGFLEADVVVAVTGSAAPIRKSDVGTMIIAVSRPRAQTRTSAPGDRDGANLRHHGGA